MRAVTKESERKFRAGAHHAACRLAEAIERAQTIEEARSIADLFTDLIGEGRLRIEQDFDLPALISRAAREGR
jgi:hypothetical protein